MCFQELFYGPYFCQVQDAEYYDYTEYIPDGPTTKRFQALAKELNMVMVLPMYEIEQPGVYYNTAAVIDADGTYLGKFRKQHIPQVKGFWEKFYFRPGNGGYPIFDTAVGKVGVYICYDRHFPEGWRALGLNGAEIVFNPSATHRGLSEYLWSIEQPAAAVANMYYVGAINRVGIEPLGENDFYGQSYFVDPAWPVRRRQGRPVRARADRPRTRHGPHQGSPRRLGVLPRSSPRCLRRTRRALRGDHMSTTLIQNGLIVSAVGRRDGDVLIDGEKIVAILAPGQAASMGIVADRTIDATGKYVVPGGVDVHTHMQLPFGGTEASDTFETGTRAAAWGGVTTIVDFAVQKTGENVNDSLAAWHEKAAGECAIDYGFHQIIGGVDEESLKAMTYLVDNEGVTSFKMFMAYPGVFYSDDGQILRAMQNASESGAMIMMHAENGIAIDVLVAQSLARGDTDPKFHSLTRPAELESEATHRAIQLAKVAGNVPLYIVHMSASEALEEVAAAQHHGMNVFAETCPQYLYLTLEDQLAQPGFEGAKWVCSTPLRTKHEHHQSDLWKGLRMNELAVVSTDHCPFCMKDQKELGLGNFSAIPNGIGGVEHRMELIYQGVVAGEITLERWVETCSTSPARMFGLDDKGVIAPGCRRRHPRVGSEVDDEDRHQRQAPHEHGPLRLRRLRDRRQGRHRDQSRHRRHRERHLRRHQGPRQVHQARPLHLPALIGHQGSDP